MSVINTNVMALKGKQHNVKSASLIATSIERLSSGLRVNSAKDDAAGAGISNRMQSQIVGLNQASRNANDAISLSQTAQSILDSVNAKLQRIRELSIQALNDTLSKQDKDVVQSEINWNLKEIDRLASTAQFNGIPLMDGSAGRLDFQIGAMSGQRLGLDFSGPGFNVEALGLKDLNIAGLSATVSERSSLVGQARDIPLNDTATTIHHGTLPLYYQSGVGYYISDNANGFQRVSVQAVHDTATDQNSITFSGHQPFYRNQLVTQALTLPSLPSNQRFLIANDTYYLEERYADGSLGYRDVEFTLSFQEYLATGTHPDGSTYSTRTYQSTVDFQPAAAINLGHYSALGASIEFNGVSYDLANAEETSIVSSSGTILADAQLVHNSVGIPYLATGSGEDTRYYRLDSVDQINRMQLATAATPSVIVNPHLVTEVNESFTFDGTQYELSDFNEITLANSDAVLVQDEHGQLYEQQTQDGIVEFYALSAVTTAYDLQLTANNQGFRGIDFASEATQSTIKQVDFTNISDIEFAGAGFSELTDISLVQRTTSDRQWAIRGTTAEGALAYFEADLLLSVNSAGEAVAAIVSATQVSPSLLGESVDQVERISGVSQITIDPRNVTVEYTDSSGNTYDDVLKLSDDGSYYFKLPSVTASLGGYKTATLVDVDGTSEVLLRTLHGGAEVAIYYATNATQGINYSVTALTDADGFDDDGIAHTRLRIVELGDDFRLRHPANPLAAIDRAIGMVDAKRSYLGAMENRFESIITNNNGMEINLSAARSRIMDTDYAIETAAFARAQILNQVGQTMLAQANTAPETVLALLRGSQ